MFFDSKQVNGILVCEKCKSRPDGPRLLECGNTICLACYQSIQLTENGQFTCFACSEMHKMPEKGLPVNKLILEFLSLETVQVSRGQDYHKLQSILNDIQANQILLNYINHPDFLKEHFLDLKNKVQLSTEQVCEQFHVKNKEFMDEIDQFENQLNFIDLESFKSLKEMTNELQTFLNQTRELLKNHNLDDEILSKLNHTANLLKKKSSQEIDYLKRVKLNNQFLGFKPHKLIVSKSSIGEICILERSTILDFYVWMHSTQRLNEVYEELGLSQFMVYDKPWTCIYRASRDGFSANDFHTKCDYKPNTFILIQAYREVFGGYTEQSWDSDQNAEGVIKQDPNAFIFSLLNRDTEPFVTKNFTNGIKCSKNMGPIFGEEIVIGSNSDKSENCSSNLGKALFNDVFSLRELEVFTNFSKQSNI